MVKFAALELPYVAYNITLGRENRVVAHSFFQQDLDGLSLSGGVPQRLKPQLFAVMTDGLKAVPFHASTFAKQLGLKPVPER